MNPSTLAERSDDESVSADRLAAEVVESLDGDEVPRYLLLGESLDVAEGGATERVYPSVDSVVNAVVTGRRVVVVVPQVLDSRVETANIDELSAEATGDGEFRDLSLDLPDRHLLVNASEGEEPAAFVTALERERATVRQTPERGVGDVEGRGATRDDDGSTADQAPEPAADPIERIERLAELNKKGIITDDEFEEKKADLLSQV